MKVCTHIHSRGKVIATRAPFFYFFFLFLFLLNHIVHFILCYLLTSILLSLLISYLFRIFFLNLHFSSHSRRITFRFLSFTHVSLFFAPFSVSCRYLFPFFLSRISIAHLTHNLLSQFLIFLYVLKTGSILFIFPSNFYCIFDAFPTFAFFSSSRILYLSGCSSSSVFCFFAYLGCYICSNIDLLKIYTYINGLNFRHINGHTYNYTNYGNIRIFYSGEICGLFGRYFQRNAYTHKYVSHSLYLSLPLYVSQSLSFHLFPLLFVCFSYSVCLSLPFHVPIPCSFSFVDPYLMCVCMYMYVCESAFFFIVLFTCSQV